MILLVGFEVLTVVVMKSTVFWDIMPCNPVKVKQHFGGTKTPPSSGLNKPSKMPA
jgi:hypothetical protein